MWWTVFKTMAYLLPLVIIGVREGRLRGEAMDQVISHLLYLQSERVKRAKAEADKQWEKDNWER